MKSKQLNYFIGKVCTIFTGPINRTFDERQSVDYFVGKVEAVDDFGITTAHPITGCKNYFFLNWIFAISEEQVLDLDKPDDAALLNEYQKLKQVKKESDSPFIDMDQLTELSNLSKA